MSFTGLVYVDPRSKRTGTNNQALPGSYYKFYLTGTLVPAPIYSDGNLTNQFPSNSISSDGSGLFPVIYLDPTIVYRRQLYDINNVIIDDLDPINDDNFLSYWQNGTPDPLVVSPASGIALTVNGIAGSSAILVNTGNTTGSGVDVSINRNGSTANLIAAGPNVQLSDVNTGTGTVLQHSGGQTELWQNNGAGWKRPLSIGTLDNVVISPAISGASLLVLAAPNAAAVTMTGSVVAGQSFGAYIQAGTNSSDSALNVSNASAQPLFTVRGDGVVKYSAGTQPAFHAQMANTSSMALQPAVITTVIFGASQLNQGSGYNLTTGVFSAPVAGLYTFSSSVTIENSSVGNAVIGGVYFSLNNADFSLSPSTGVWSLSFPTSTLLSGVTLTNLQYITCVGVLGPWYMNAGDNMRIKTQTGGANIMSVLGTSYFAGYLLG